MTNIITISLGDPNIWIDLTVYLSILFGLLVITSNNPMYSILYLIGLFVTVAGYLYYNTLAIMSLLYILIYVGAIAILFLFILSLLDVKVSELGVKSNSNDIPLVIFVTTLLFFIFYKYVQIELNILNINDLLNYKLNYIYEDIFNTVDYKNILDIYLNNMELPKSLYYILSNNWYEIYSINELTAVGNLFYTEYAILFLLLGIILLLSIVGAIVVTTIKK